MKKIWTLTMNPAIDLNCTVDEVTPGRKLRCDNLRIEAGGGGVNVARGLKRLGAEVTAIFPASGKLGEYYRSLLEEQDLDCMMLDVQAGMSRINNNVRETSENRQYRFCVPGSKLREEEWQEALDRVAEVLEEGDILVLSGSLPPGVPKDFNARVARQVSRAGGRLILDTPGDLLDNIGDTTVAWITPNKREFEELIGRSVEAGKLEAELEGLVRDTPIENVLLTMGQDGAIYAGSEGTRRIGAPEVEKRSAVGAGDSAVAGLAWALANDCPASKALGWAVAAGSAAVKTPGSNLLQKEDFEHLRETVEKQAR